jgi:uncharacterized membrane protein
MNYTWTGAKTLSISHDGLVYGTKYNVSIAATVNITGTGTDLAASFHIFTTEYELFNITIGPLMDSDDEVIEGALIKVILPNGTKLTAETDENGNATYLDQPWAEFPADTEFKATHDDYRGTLTWEQGDDIPEFLTGGLPLYVFIVIGVVLLVVLIIVIFVILYGGKKEDEQKDEEQLDDDERCPGCDAKVEEDAKKCGKCGKKLNQKGTRCPECGAKVDNDTTTCDECGAEFGSKE